MCVRITKKKIWKEMLGCKKSLKVKGSLLVGLKKSCVIYMQLFNTTLDILSYQPLKSLNFLF